MMKKIIAIYLLTLLGFQLNAQQRALDIGILLDYRTPETEPLLQQLKEEVIKVVGEDATVNFPEALILSHQYKKDQASVYYQQLASKADIILAFGNISENVISQQGGLTKPTIVFQSKEFGPEVTGRQQKENLVRITDRPTFAYDIEAFHKLTQFKQLGVAIVAPYVSEQRHGATLDSLSQKLGFDYQIIPYTNLDELSSRLESLDAFYLTGALHASDSALSALATQLQKAGLPSMTAGGINYLERGFMATTQPSDVYNQFVRRVALTVDKLIRGEAAFQLSSQLEYELQLTVDYNQAVALKVPLAYSHLDDVNFIGKADELPAGQVYDFSEFLGSTLKRNRGFGASKQEVLIRQQDLKTAKSNYLPTVEAAATSDYVDAEFAQTTFGQNAEFQSIGSLNLRQVIYSPDASMNIKVQKSMVKLGQQNLTATELDLVLEASQAYVRALLAKAQVDIQANNLKLTKSNYETAKRNLKAGLTNKSDLLRFSSRLSQDKQEMVEAINEWEQALVEINQLMNNPLDQDIDITDLRFDEGFFAGTSYEQFRQLLDHEESREHFVRFMVVEANRKSPELGVLRELGQISSVQMDRFGKGRYMPTLSLQGSYQHFIDRSGAGSVLEGFNLPNNNYTVGVAMTIPIMNGGRNSISYQRAKIQSYQVELNTQEAKLGLETQIRNGTFQVINQMANVKLSIEAEATAKEALEMIQTSYANGAVSIIQLFDVQNTYLQAQVSRVQANYGYMLSKIFLERFIAHYSNISSDQLNQTLKERFLTFPTQKLK